MDQDSGKSVTFALKKISAHEPKLVRIGRGLGRIGPGLSEIEARGMAASAARFESALALSIAVGGGRDAPAARRCTLRRSDGTEVKRTVCECGSSWVFTLVGSSARSCEDLVRGEWDLHLKSAKQLTKLAEGHPGCARASCTGAAGRHKHGLCRVPASPFDCAWRCTHS